MPRISRMRVNTRKIRKLIDQAQISTPGMRTEIRRVFALANKRIAALKRSSLLSPALEALGAEDRFSVGALRGKTGRDWQELRGRYYRALTFVNQETSTITGAKKYKRVLQTKLGLAADNAAFEAAYESLSQTVQTMMRTDQALRTYRQVMDTINQQQAQLEATEMQAKQSELEREYQRNVDANTKAFADAVKGGVSSYRVPNDIANLFR